MTRKLVAEAVGTFWLVASIVGTAMLAAGVPEVGVGWLGVSFAAGIAVVGMAYALGGISGGHFNPAVTLGLAIAGRTSWGEVIPYWIAQVVGGVLGAALVYAVASSAAGFAGGIFASNGYAALSPGGYSLFAGLLLEVAVTGGFILVILGATSRAAPAGFAPLAIGLTLVLAHLIAIPVTNASINPARSTAAAVFGGGEPLAQLWLFWVAPLLGGALGGVLWKYLLAPGEAPEGIGQK